MAQVVPGLKEQQTKKEEVPKVLKPLTHQFKVQFLWKPTRLSERLAARRAKAAGTDNQLVEGDN